MADFTPLFQESGDAIRARLNADANAGLTADDPQQIDVREGSFFYDVTEAVLIEMARLWDALGSEVPASAFPTHAWGDYLDAHAETFGLTRKNATAATGVITVNGVTATNVPQGTSFSTDAATVDTEGIEFQTTPSVVVLSPSLTMPTNTGSNYTATVQSGGTLSGNFYYFVAAKSAYGETLPTLVNSTQVSPSGQKVRVQWPAATFVSPATGQEAVAITGYSIYRGTTNVASAAGLIGTVTGTTALFDDTGSGTPGAAPNTEDLSAGAKIAVRAVEEGADGNVTAGAITNIESPITGLVSVTNEVTTGGADTESDEDLRSRILLEYAGQGAGTQADYKRWALAQDGIGSVYVEPVSAGNVLVVVTDKDGKPVKSTGTVAEGNLVLAVQQSIDPTRQASGNTTGLTSTVLTDSAQSWSTDQWKGLTAVVGTGTSQVYGTISSNTATTVTVAQWRKVTDNTVSTPSSPQPYAIGSSPLLASGLGLAPVGAAVTVTTPALLTVNVTATISLKPGFAIATEQAAIEASLQTYLDSLNAEDNVVYRRIQAAFFEAVGVSDVTNLALSATANPSSSAITWAGTTGSSDITISNAQIATLGTVTVTVA